MAATKELVLNGLTAPELAYELAALGIRPALSPQLLARVHGRSESRLEALEVPGLSRSATQALAGAGAHIRRLSVLERHVSQIDGFRKYLFGLDDGLQVETVGIPLPAGPHSRPDHHVVCVSSQAGCALDCAFCATGRARFGRNLEAWEIVEQVARVRDDVDAPVRGVVFMGMGEPFLNYDNVMRAAEILAEPAGLAIARKAMTLSTAGVVPGIRRFTREGRKHRLAISLTSAIPEKRARLMPRAAKYPLPELVEAARAYTEAARERVVIAYVMISKENVGREDAEALMQTLSGLRVRLNLIDINDASGRFAPPSPLELERFRNWLAPLGQPVVRRYSGGKDIAAACGMLAAKHPRPARIVC